MDQATLSYVSPPGEDHSTTLLTVATPLGRAPTSLSFRYGSTPIMRGDPNADGAIDLSDAIGVLYFLYGGGTLACEEAGDANNDGSLDIGDAIYILTYIFGGGPAPPSPTTTGC